MHIHVFGGNWPTASTLALFLANGVTGVRDMGSDLDRVLALRREIASGSRLGPRMVVSGPSIFGLEDGRIPISAEQARVAVRQRSRAGVDFIKLYSYLSPAAFFAAIDEARKAGLTAVGHVPYGVKASEAARAGFQSMEHLDGTFLEGTDVEEALRAEIEVRVRDRRQEYQVPQISLDQVARYRDHFDKQELQRLSALFVRLRTWQTPTFASPETSAHVIEAMHSSFTDYPNLRYVPPAIEESWKRTLTARFSPTQMANFSTLISHKRAIGTAMHRAGVPLLSGTDAPGPGQVPGFSLHDELNALVQIGLSPLEALQTATINPARFLGRQKDLGTVERGKLADFVMLDGNPLVDIDNARRISGVVVNGRYLGKDSLNTMLAEVEARAERR
jgi:imidazolonepropionase-like amidohydrolase